MHVQNNAHPNIDCKKIIFGNGLFIDRSQIQCEQGFEKQIVFLGFQFTNAQHTISNQQQLKRLNKSLCQTPICQRKIKIH
jgi:hypothetical protein